MTLREAIELCGRDLKEDAYDEGCDLVQGIKLLIEAGNFIILSRVAEPGSVPKLLPGETD